MGVEQGDAPSALALVEDALVVSRGDPPVENQVRGVLGDLLLASGDRERTREQYLASLSSLPASRRSRTSARTLERCGTLLAAAGDHETAAELLAAADALCALSGEVRGATRRPQYEKALETCRAGLDDEAFRAAWTRGAALDWPAAAARARGALEGLAF